MKCENGQARLDKADLIRINQLVRPTIDYEGFRAWYQELAVSEQVALIAGLCYLAYQTGVSEAVYAHACQAAAFAVDGEFVLLMKRVRDRGGLNVRGVSDWLLTAEPGKGNRVRSEEKAIGSDPYY